MKPPVRNDVAGMKITDGLPEKIFFRELKKKAVLFP
jgi:hypothetical protein